MSEKPPTGPPPTSGPTAFPAAPPAPPPWPTPPQIGSPRPSRWPTLAALVVAIIGVGLGVAAWFRPMPHTSPHSAPPAPSYTDQQVAEAKSNVCDAYNATMRAVRLNTNRPDPVPGDVVGSLAAAAHARLALYAGGDYLQDRLSAEPATPADLAKPVKSLANTLKEAGIVALGNEDNSALDPFRRAVDTEVTNIERLCK